MDPKSVYITVTLVILVNGSVLSAIHDLPSSLRPAAQCWRLSTLLVALGCAAFAMQAYLPQPFVVILGNGAFFACLTLYYLAVRKFFHLPSNLSHWAPAALGMVIFLYFVLIQPNTEIRIILISIIWVWLMGATAAVLLDRRHRDGSRSRKILAALFIMALIVTAARGIFYIYLHLGPNLNIADNTHWLNAVTPVCLAILPVIGTTSFILMCTDQVRRHWEHAASRDYLTGLPNRRTLTQFGIATIENSQRANSSLSVAVLDIDRFKLINDTHGHEVGDKVLKHVADRLQASMRKEDFLARSGGEEFVIIFSEASSHDAVIATERVREAIQADPFIDDMLEVPVTVSIGLARQIPNVSSFEDILRRADKALYIAKSLGRNRVAVTSTP